MNDAIRQMLAPYACRTAEDYEYALRELFQQLALLGLWRGRFFEHAAFYGGTALRILYGLDRFSEDLDFSLLADDEAFDFAPYGAFIQKEIEAWGFSAQINYREKPATPIQSAFLKADTRTQLLSIEASESLTALLPKNRIMRIKIEVDIHPPPAFTTRLNYVLQPIPFPVRVYSESCLFAGKMHAVLCRKWKNRVKGRDWYDWVWYLSRKTPLNLDHLRSRMIQSGHWPADRAMTRDDVHRLLRERIEQLDVDAARVDAARFLKNPESVLNWTQELFFQLVDALVTE